MSRKYELLIVSVVLTVSFLLPNPAFSQAKAAEVIDSESFAAMMTKVTELAAIFGDRLKQKKIGEISEEVGPLGYLTLDQYFKYGVKTNKGTSFFMEKDIPVAEMTSAGKTVLVSHKASEIIMEYLLKEFHKFYKEISTVLADICKTLKKSPVRLDEVSVELAPLGVGATITIGINYDSPIFGK